MRISTLIRTLLALVIIATLLGRSSLPPADPVEQVRAFTRTIEFDYITWTWNALIEKLAHNALGATRYFTPQSQRSLVLNYLDTVHKEAVTEQEISLVYSNPKQADPAKASADLRQNLASYNRALDSMGPLAESVLQSQLNEITSSLGLTLGGEPIPPIWYRSTATPLALIVSPRSDIRTEADISLIPDLSIDQIDLLEKQVSQRLDVSALVVPIGGIGIYPTMVMQTNDLPWLVETIAHEWTHNFLTLRPLGLSYETTPELRTMNETTASIAGKEIGAAVIRKYYSELATQNAAPSPPPANPQPSAPVFNFNNEMRKTRVQVDQFLSQGKVAEAESYMEKRRELFWENGYYIRKLNQAYFAFYGAYADVPGGAAGEDPVGPAVRALRLKSGSLVNFLNQISWMTSFQQLQEAVR